MNYDRLGRLVDVKAPAAQNVGHASISDLVTQYTELGDRRRIYAVYQRNGDANALSSDKWYNYDAEGRITIVDGVLSNGVISTLVVGATEVSYDALGRRWKTA